MLGTGAVSADAVERAATVVAKHGHSLAALQAYTEILVDRYERGLMPQDARVAFRRTIEALHEATYDAALNPTTARMSNADLERAVTRTGALVTKSEREVARLEGQLDETIERIDRREAEAAGLIRQKKTLLAATGLSKERSQTTAMAKSAFGLVPGLKLAKVSLFIPGLQPIALAALLYGGYSAWQGVEESAQLADQIRALERRITGATAQLEQLRAARGRFDKNLTTLRGALDVLRTLEASYRAKDTGGSSTMLQLAKQMRKNELIAYALKQQIGVLGEMNAQAGELDEHLAELVEALSTELGEAELESKEAQADFLTAVLEGVFAATNIRGIASEAIREAVLLTCVGEEVSIVGKVRTVLEHLSVDEDRIDEVCRSAASLVEAIDHLVQHRSEVMDPSFDEALATLSEPQRFLVDVALSRTNQAIDPGPMIALVREIEIDDATALRVAQLVHAGDKSAMDVLRTSAKS